MKTQFIILIFSLLIGIAQSCNNKSSINHISSEFDSLTQTRSDSFNNFVLIDDNKKFKFNDSSVLRLVRQDKDLRAIIDWKCNDDSTIINELVIDGVPNDTNPDWTIMIRQYQPRIPISNRILTLFVNSENGKIRIWDIPNDTILTLDSWKKQR